MKTFITILVLISSTAWAKETPKFSLENCIQYALKNSKNIQKQKISLESSRERVLIQSADFDFTLDASSSRQLDDRNDNHRATVSKRLPGGFTIGTTARGSNDHVNNDESNSIDFTITKKLLDGASELEDLINIQDAETDVRTATNDLQLNERQVRFQVQRSYYALIRDRQSLSIQKTRVKAAEQSLLFVKEKDSSPVDISVSQVQLSERKLAVIQNEIAISSTLDELKRLMGFPVQDQLEVSDKFQFATFDYKLQEDIDHSLAKHEDFLNSRNRKRKLDRAFKVAGKNLLPDLDLVYNRNLSSSGANTNLHGEDNQTIGLNLSWTIGNRRERASKAIAKNNINDYKADLFLLKQRKIQRLRELDRRLQESIKAISIQEEQIIANEFRQEVFRIRWTNNEISILEYVRAQNDLQSARVQLINLQTNYMTLKAEYLFEAAKQ